LEDHPASDADRVACRDVDLEVAVTRPNLLDRMSEGDANGVGIMTGIQEPLPLLTTHTNLLGQILIVLIVTR
jgi:hypothetical protein